MWNTIHENLDGTWKYNNEKKKAQHNIIYKVEIYAKLNIWVHECKVCKRILNKDSGS